MLQWQENDIGGNCNYFFFFGFGGGSFSRVNCIISASCSGFSSQSGLTGAVFFEPGYALVSLSSNK